MNPPSERRNTRIPLPHRRPNKASPLVLLRGHHKRATSMLDPLLRPTRAPALSSHRDWWPQNSSRPSTSAHTAERVSLALAASRCVSYLGPCVRQKRNRNDVSVLFQIHVHSHTGERRKYQFMFTISAIIISAADAATPQRSNALLRGAPARLACRATCAATHARICRRETRRARATTNTSARRVPRSLRESNSRSRWHPLDEPRLRPADPAGWVVGGDHGDASLLYSARSFHDWTEPNDSTTA
jgi:hypothetical protein